MKNETKIKRDRKQKNEDDFWKDSLALQNVYRDEEPKDKLNSSRS